MSAASRRTEVLRAQDVSKRLRSMTSPAQRTLAHSIQCRCPRTVPDPASVPAGIVLLLPPHTPLTHEEEQARFRYMDRRLR